MASSDHRRVVSKARITGAGHHCKSFRLEPKRCPPAGGQDRRVLARSRPVRLIPGRPAHLGAGWLAQVDPAGGPVRVVVRG
jgi:hypothetical protein